MSIAGLECQQRAGPWESWPRQERFAEPNSNDSSSELSWPGGPHAGSGRESRGAGVALDAASSQRLVLASFVFFLRDCFESAGKGLPRFGTDLLACELFVYSPHKRSVTQSQDPGVQSASLY